jgi:methyl-accepting chemotaxis protein
MIRLSSLLFLAYKLLLKTKRYAHRNAGVFIFPEEFPMRRMTLKNKLVTGSLAMVIPVMVASAIVVGIVINKQSRAASYGNLEKSLNIVRKELLVMQMNLLSDTRQMAAANDMGGRVIMTMEMKNNISMLTTYMRDMANDIGQIGMTGKIWKVAIYNLDRELCAFGVQQNDEKFLLGFVSDPSKGSLKGVIADRNKQTENADWKDLDKFQDANIKLKFKEAIPQKENVHIGVVENSLGLISTVPIFAHTFNTKTNKYENKLTGFAMAIKKLDNKFAARMSDLTAVKLNFFTKAGFSLGDLKDYGVLSIEKIKDTVKGWNLKNAKTLLNDIDLKEGGYFQGVLCLYDKSRYIGAIAALQSTDIARANTLQMVRILGPVYLIFILMITFCAIIFAKSLTRPIYKIITTLNDGSQRVSSASNRVSVSSHQLAEGSSEQAASLEETSSSLEEMASMTQSNADSAIQVEDLTGEANRIVAKADASMTLLTSSMDGISNASEETSKIVKSIDEIAFQTNLLALNAAVEAARAGEAGAGFAVVADEVRNLAKRAADAARNSAEMIEGTVKKVTEGSGLVKETAKAFKEVSESTQKIGELVGEIATASKEQAQGIEQINKAVAETDQVVQRNAASAEESASASSELDVEAAEMKKVVNDLVALVGGGAVMG